LHLQSAFEYLGYQEGDFQVCEDYAKRIFSLPMHPYLGKADQERIAQVIRNKNT
ncbi:DegT/DnrJ/EryC1/StrS family aminotransferase, partial [bacterium]|nr:DegT/DnrJ/EryC1/StrS family aminotransferase [bacterium]